MSESVRLRIKLVEPPADFAFCLQKGKGSDAERLLYKISRGGDLSFDLELEVREGKSGSANFTGPFAQGPPASRFFYLSVGECPETDEPRWRGRVKVPLSSITWDIAQKVLRDPKKVLEASYAATAPKGGPALATVPLLGSGWKAVRR